MFILKSTVYSLLFQLIKFKYTHTYSHNHKKNIQNNRKVFSKVIHIKKLYWLLWKAERAPARILHKGHKNLD